MLHMAAHWGHSIVFFFHVIKEWLGSAVHDCALGLFYCFLLSCDKRMTAFCCAQLHIGTALLFFPFMWYKGDWIRLNVAAHGSRSIVLDLHVIIGWYIGQVTLCVGVCFFVWSCLSSKCIKVGVIWGWFCTLLPFPHHYLLNQTMSPTYTSFLFSFKEDTSAPNVVEAMEQVGDPFSLCLK